MPQALCDSEGLPNKGNKKNWTDKLQKRYFILTPDLPLSWTPEAVLMDGMFFINITPLQHTSNVQEYGKFIYYTHTTQKEPMKYTYCSTVFNHRCSIQRNTNSTEGTGMYPKVLQQGQLLVLAGCFSGENQHTATVITGGDAREGESTYPSPDESYKSSALEVDQRIWRHALITRSQDLLLYSPDTDIYNIGLSLLEQQLSNKTIVVQINVLHKEKKYLNALLQKFRDDSDLESLSTNTIGKALQTAFIGAGCDYISFFSGFGKASVLDNIFQYAKFITGGECPGTLANTDLLTKDKGFQAFVRLIGTFYYKKHLSGFAAIGKTTPNQLYYSITGDNRLKEWWNAIRSTCSERILTEEQRPPTYTALQKHWERACWVSQMWN